MTDEEEPKKKRKPQRAGATFGRLAQATVADPVPQGDRDRATPRHHDTTESRITADHEVVARHRATTPPAKRAPVRSFTVRLYDERDGDALDDWLRAARRRVGQKVDASRLVRELLREVSEDPALTARLHDRLRQDEP